jgi:hypothetical protein
MLRAALCLAALLGPAPLAAQGSRHWRPEERVIIEDFSWVQAIAASDEIVYAATRGGLGVYDRRFRRWEPPVTRLDGYPAERVLAALVDPSDRSLWLGTEQGLVHYQPTLRLFERIIVPGGVDAMMFDRDHPFRGLFIAAGRGWQFLPRGSPIPTPAQGLPGPGRRIASTTAEEVLARFPFVSALRPLTLTDERLRQYRYTAGSEVESVEEAYLGTNGYGVVRVDALTASLEPMPFGLLSPVAGAVTPAGDGVWVGSGPTRRVGFTHVSRDAQEYRYEEGPAAGFRFRDVRDLVALDGDLWAATDAGVIHVGGGREEPLTTSTGLPTDNAFAVAAAAAGVWIGTARGLAFASDEGVVERVDARVSDAVLALAPLGDTVWVGTARGLAVTWRGRGEILIPPDVRRVPQLADPIRALALTGDTVVAATFERILWRAPGAEWVVERIFRDLGDVVALAGAPGGVWIAGQRGVAFYGFGTRAYAIFNAPDDLPAPVRDMAVTEQYVWLATEAGLVRFEKQALLP